MNGLGFFIWQLANMPEPKALAEKLVSGGVKWVVIKGLDGVYLFNAKNGNQKLLKEYQATLESYGIDVYFYQYVYGGNPGAEGDAATAFYEEFKPKAWFIDAEGEYKRFGAGRAAKAYCDKLHNGQVETFLCSYRFPSLHGGLVKPFPFSAFLNHEKVDGTAPQVYWCGSHNPGQQLAQSLNEYRGLTSKRFVPIGSAFGERAWEATAADLRVFVATALGLGLNTYGFWSLDYILKNNRKDYWEAITGISTPPPPPPTNEDKIHPLYVAKVTATALNARAGDGASYSDIGTLLKDSELPVVEEVGDWVKAEFWANKNYIEKV